MASVVDFVDNDGQPPAQLQTAFLSKQWETLPETGGLYDQDAALLKQMTVLYNIYQALVRLRNAKGDEIHSLTDGDRRIIASLLRLGVL